MLIDLNRLKIPHRLKSIKNKEFYIFILQIQNKFKSCGRIFNLQKEKMEDNDYT
jgi:hypothetical protein